MVKIGILARIDTIRSKGIAVSEYEFTPGEAEELLKRTQEVFRNRRITRPNVEKIKAALRTGEWRLNGETIKLDKDGICLDGQHRLVACVETGINMKTMIAFNVSRDVFMTIDNGLTKSIANVVEIAGYSSATMLSAIARLVFMAETGLLQTAPATLVSKQQILDTIATHRDMQEMCSVRVGFMSGVGSPSSFLAVMYYARKHDKTLAQSFTNAVMTGESIEKGDPMFALRERFINMKPEKRGSIMGRHEKVVYIWDVTSLAWNAYVEGRRLSKSQIGRLGTRVYPYGFPVHLVTRKPAATEPQ